MRKLLKSMKTLLLVAAGLCVGATNAWAAAGDVTTNVNLTFAGTATFTANKTYTYTKGDGEVLSSATGTVWNDGGATTTDRIGLKLTDGQLIMSNGNMTINFDGDAASTKDIVAIEFDLAYPYQYSKTTDRTVEFSASAGETVVVKESFNFNKGTMTSSTMGLTTDYIKYAAATTDWNDKVHFALTFNYATQKITMTTACATASETAGEFSIDMPANTGALTKFYISCGSANYGAGRYAIFDDLIVNTTEGDYSTTADITLAFQDDSDNDISGLYTGQTVFTVDKSTTFTPSNYYPTAMYDGDYKYAYSSGGDAFEVTTDATVTLVYTKIARPTHTLNVTASYGGNSKKIVDNVSIQEASDYTYYYPRFIKDGTTLYEYSSSTDANASASYWTSTLSNFSANASYTLTYEALDGTCVYYAEGEDITGATSWAHSDYKPYMSNGSSGAITSATIITTLDAGVYSVTARAIGRANDRYVDIYKTSAEDENKVLRVTSQNKGGENTANFTLTGSTDIIANGGYAGGSSGHACDYIYIMQLPASVSAEITDVGAATFVSEYALDFSNVAGLDAYIATAQNGANVTFNKVTAVPAGTPLYLKGTTANVPVVAKADAVGTNLLVAGTGAEIASQVGDKYNFILNKIDDVVGFYKAAGQTVATNRAYLSLSDNPFPGGPAKSVTMVFNDETTGITTVAAPANKAVVKGTYNMQGQRVQNPTKGLYIVDGKKVVIN